MPDQDKKVKATEKSTDKKQQGVTTRDYSDLKRLLCLLNVQSSKQQLPAINFDSAQNSMMKSEPAVRAGGHRAHRWHESTEAVELENFSINYKNERNFSKHPQNKLFQEIFTALVKNRLICREWVDRAPSLHFLRVLICLRLLMRDPCYQEILHSFGGIENLAQYMEIVAHGYLGYGEAQHSVDKLVNMTYIFQKLAAVRDQREWVTTSGAHKTLVNLLSARDTNVLLGALLALASLAESPECREKISELNIVENLLMILHEYDLLSKRLTAELLRLLCAERQVREQVKLYEGVPVLLSLLHSDHLKLLWSVVWILVQICEDPETSVEIRIWGGIKQLLHILRGDRNFVSDRSSIGSLSSANAAGRIQQLRLSEDLSPREIQENTFSLQAACCAALTELVLDDSNAHQVVQLYHPNVVRYYKTFLENDRLYIVMELIEGAPLGEHFSSLKEKRHHFAEERLWKIFIQLCLALRYLHKEKRIIHRDLTPNNIMLGDKDRVTVTDFGLAKQKQESSRLTSVVGTILYSCPEVLKSEPYGEKADVWAAGCILYQMATLEPPFYSTNMLSLATKIVEAVYEPVPEGVYSEKVITTISRCLNPDAETRPDIVEVSSMISDIMMKYVDNLSTSQLALEKKLERERRRTQRYFMEANRNSIICQQEPTLLSQETFEKASLSSSSSGAGSLKSELSEITDLPAEGFQASCGKDEDRACDGLLSDDNFNLENIEKDIYSELDDELDISDNFSSSSSSPLKESTFSTLKRSFSASGGERQSQTRDFTGGIGSRLRPALLPLDLLLKVPPLLLSAHVKELEAELVTGWQSHSLPTVILHSLKDHVSAGIAVSQRKVRQISDPIQQILIQLHKVIYITQLPPALHHNLKRRIIERFKKSLFSQQSNPCNLKSEIKKLSQGSPEPIEPNFFTADYHLLYHSLGGNNLSSNGPTGLPSSFDLEEGITYEQMQTVIEEVLEESGYYNFISNRYHSYPWGTKNYPTKR
ncbi:serine/threonine-protein kinase Nek10 isoform X7 [Moschus berezovskii]|uniref:serine/threonine-protein kinase Nek10 isoform X7 n=1 Tax=Moschus berezovskii TaxID=68408 RepID=UPI002444627D|nr:serine/threonine-protein kinase Nek10 isoform X7 [Moschus berezovskii]